ncbi:MAG: aspartyl protease family protein [Acidobacteria bacterium]|nr:aspartyl protease family protein [Candidatus Sulfomarinibacter kjeldsenii]
MTQTRFLILFLAATMIVGLASKVIGFEGEGNPTPPSCVHESVYEPFAGLVLMSVTVADSPPLDFVIDTGATSSSVTDPLLALALGLEVKETGLARGVGSGATRVSVAKDTSIRIDGVEVLRTSLVVHDIGTRLAATTGREIHGFIGSELFERYVVEINPVGSRMLLHDPETFDYRGPGFEVPLEVVDRRPVVSGTVVVREGGKEVPVRLLADTGSGRFLGLIIKSRRHLKPPAEQRTGVSVGVVGDTTVVVAMTQKLQLGSIVARRVETAWMEAFGVPAVRNIENLNGILGNQFLGSFRTFYDYRGGRLILEPVDRSAR